MLNLKDQSKGQIKVEIYGAIFLTTTALDLHEIAFGCDACASDCNDGILTRAKCPSRLGLNTLSFMLQTIPLMVSHEARHAGDIESSTRKDKPKAGTARRGKVLLRQWTSGVHRTSEKSERAGTSIRFPILLQLLLRGFSFFSPFAIWEMEFGISAAAKSHFAQP